MILGAFAYSRKVPIISITSACLSAYISTAFTGRIYMKLDIRNFHETLPRNSKFRQNRAYFTRRRNYMLLLLAKLIRHKTFFPVK